MHQHIITATTQDKKQRIDKVLARHIPELSRTLIQKLISKGHALLNDETIITDPAYLLLVEDTVTLTLPPPEPTEMQPANIPLDVVYEDADFLVINKPAGMTVHPGAGNYQDTLANALLYHCGDSLSGIGGVERPGIVHRLDKDTSGLILAAKSDAAHHSLAHQIATRSAKRTYLAWCFGLVPPGEHIITTQLGRHSVDRQKMAVLASGGKLATTHYRLLQHFGRIASLVECRLDTGRTHQIRVHMTHLKYPLIGDPVYGKAPPLSSLPGLLAEYLEGFHRQALHSWKLELAHPITGEPLCFTAPPPQELETLQELLEDL